MTTGSVPKNIVEAKVAACRAGCDPSRDMIKSAGFRVFDFHE